MTSTEQTELQILIIMLTDGNEQQKKEAFNKLGFSRAMAILAHAG